MNRIYRRIAYHWNVDRPIIVVAAIGLLMFLSGAFGACGWKR